jgi:hypothetical protein
VWPAGPASPPLGEARRLPAGSPALPAVGIEFAMASTLLGAGWRREWGGVAAAAARWAEAALGRAPAAAAAPAAEEGAWLMGKRDARTRKGKVGARAAPIASRSGLRRLPPPLAAAAARPPPLTNAPVSPRRSQIFRGSNGRMRLKPKNVEVNQWIPRPAPATAAPPAAEPHAAAALAFARLHLAA